MAQCPGQSLWDIHKAETSRNDELQELSTQSKVDIAVHHLVANHLEKFVDLSTKPQSFGTFGDLLKLKNVKKFCTDQVPTVFPAYGWGSSESDFKTMVLEKSQEFLTPPAWGKRTMSCVMPAVIICGLLLLISLLLIITGAYSIYSTFFALLLVVVIIWAIALFLWVPPSRVFDGATKRALARYEAGNASDPVLAVTDLASLEQLKSIESLDHRGRLPSLDYWREYAKIANGTQPVPRSAAAVTMPVRT